MRVNRATRGVLAAILASGLCLGLARSALASVYWANEGNGHGSTVGRATLNGLSFPNQPLNQPFISGATDPAGVAVDNSHIYWANAATGTIGRANLDGSNVNQNFITGAQGPLFVAVDRTYIYWTNYLTNSIGRANIDGANPNQNFITGANSPDGIAVDSSYIYWTNISTSSIGRARLDGSSVQPTFISTGASPAGLAVDASYIYWANSVTNTIGRALLNGSDVNPRLVATADGPVGVAVDSSFVYWTSHRAQAIGRANIDGSSPNPSLITATDGPYGIAVDAVAPPSYSVAPAIVGPALVGQLISCDLGLWTGNPNPTVTYAWLRDGSKIPGSDNRPYTLVAADGGQSIACQVTASNAYGSFVATTASIVVPQPPTNTERPTVTGTPAVGQILSCSRGSWFGIQPINYTYEWDRDNGVISVGSDSNHKIVAADRGHRLTCAVIATDSNGSVRATSASVTIAAPKLPVVRAAFIPYWLVNGTSTTLTSIRWIRPRWARLAVRCTGRRGSGHRRGSGCPSGAWVGSARHIGRLVHAYNGHSLHPGAVVLFTVSLSGHRPERITFTIRNGRVPKVTVHS